MKRRGVARIIIGTILIVLQTLSAIGNALAGVKIQLSFKTLAVFIYDLVYLISYFFIGIIGLILLISGIVAYTKRRIEKTNTAQSMPNVSEFCAERQSVADTITAPTSTAVVTKSANRRFCRLCGSLIDNKSKKCTHCNKQYFRLRIPKMPLLIVLSITIVLGVVAFGIHPFVWSQAKDDNYLYDWMANNGTLIDGTYLQYSETDTNGTTFSLRYDPNLTENRRWYVACTHVSSSGYTIATTLILFWEKPNTPVSISVFGSGRFDGYRRSLEYSHNSNEFTSNSPIKKERYSGDTVVKDIFIAGQGPTTITDKTEGLQAELDNMDRICSTNAQKSLCLILDWLKNSFCSEANMKMSDFGYENY